MALLTSNKKKRHEEENNKDKEKHLEEDDSDSDTSDSSDDDSSNTSSSSGEGAEDKKHGASMKKTMDDDEDDDEQGSTSSSSDDSDSSADGEKDGDDDFKDNDDDDDVNQSNSQSEAVAASTPSGSAAATLSKSWSIQAAHVPTFTGGKVTSSSPVPSPASSGSSSLSPPPFLLLPVHGDVSVVDSVHGVSWGTIRKGPKAASSALAMQDSADDDDGDDDGLDHDAITSYALSCDNRTIVTCSRNNLLRQYEVQVTSPPSKDDDDDDDKRDDKDGDDLDETGSDTDGIITNDDGRRVMTKLVRTWGRSGHTLPVTHMSFHASNVFVATGSVDGTVRVWDVRGRYITHVFRPVGRVTESSSSSPSDSTGRYGITSLKWKPQMDELVIAIGRDDGSIAIHNLRAAAASPSADTSTPSSAVAVSGSSHHPSVLLLNDHISAVTCMEWWKSGSADIGSTYDGEDEFFITTGRDSVINLWRIVLSATDADGSKGKKKKSSKHTRTIIYRRIQTVPVYEQVEGMVILPSTSSNESTKDLCVVTAGSKGMLRKWCTHVKPGETPELTMTLQQPSKQAFGDTRGGYMGLLLNQSTSNTVAAQSAAHEIMIAVDAEHNLSFVNSELVLDRTIVGHNDEILDLKIIPNSSSIVVATNSPQVRVFDLKNFSCTVLEGHTATALCVDASPCGRYLASCGKDKTLRIWSTKDDLECLGVGTGHTEPVGACGFSQKVGKYEVGGKAARNGGGAFCVTASVDRTLKRWNLIGPDEWKDSDGPIELIASTSVRGHEKDINIISIAPNDSLVASGSQDKTVKLWNTTDLSERATLKGHKRGVWDCQFSPIDRVLATSSGDKTIKIWSLSDYSCVRTFQGHLSSVLRVRFLSTGLQLVSSGADGLLKVWTIRTNECEATLDAHSDKVWAMDLAYGASHVYGDATHKDLLVSGSADSSLLVWKDTTAELEEEHRASQAESILLDQQMSNHLRHKEFSKALEIALKVNKPMHALKILTALLENEISNRKGDNEQTVLQQLIDTWDLERIAQVLKYCRDWNTRARNSYIAMWVLRSIVTTVPVGRLASLQASQTKHGSIPEIMAGIMPYAERHFDRLDRLYGSSYLLDFLLYNMDSLDPVVDGADEDNSLDEFGQWQASSKPVLPPKYIDGRIQVSGTVLVGTADKAARMQADDNDSGSDADEVLTVGDSSDDSDSDDLN